LKLVHAYAVSPRGVPLGIVDQQWWVRAPRKKRKDCQRRALQDKETLHWVRAIEQATRALDGQRAWFQIDREGDRYWTLKALHDSGQWFTVRSTYAHRFVFTGGSRRQRRLRNVARAAPVRFVCRVAIHAKPGRQSRLAKLEVRAAPMTLDMIEALTKEQLAISGHVVEVREVGTTPKSEKALHWRLLTNRPIESDDVVMDVVMGYAKRWRIEELHRVWKSGACRVEESQLRSAARMTKWAILMVTTAARIERLRALSQSDPEKSAVPELSTYEVRALILLKRRYAKRTEIIPDGIPTLEHAVRWLAELGGYTGRSSGGPPGAVTLRRGLDFITPAAIALEALETEGKKR
jgi:Transposase Tn5 dimerisation domain